MPNPIVVGTLETEEDAKIVFGIVKTMLIGRRARELGKQSRGKNDSKK